MLLAVLPARVRRDEHVLAVVAQFADRLVDIGARQMRRLLVEARLSTAASSAAPAP